MNKCLKCGYSYNRGDFCPMCGYPIPSKRKKSLAKWIIFVVCVIFGGVLLLGFIFKPHPCLYGPRPIDDSLQGKELTNPAISEKE